MKHRDVNVWHGSPRSERAGISGVANQSATRGNIQEMNGAQPRVPWLSLPAPGGLAGGLRHIRKNLKSLWLALSVLFPCVCAHCEQPDYQIEGSFTKVERSGKESPWTDFTVYVSGNRCSVSNLYFNGELLMNGSDGTNSFCVNKMAVAKQSDRGSWEWASVTEGLFPVKDLAAGQVCWLAFAAFDCVLTNIPTLRLEGFPYNEGLLRYEASFSAAPPHLPRSIKWYGPGHWNFMYPGGDRVVEKSLPYTNFLAAEYAVISTTNLGGFEVPLGFDLSYFMPSVPADARSTNRTLGANEVDLACVLRCRVRRIKAPSGLADPRPALGSKVQIEHWRFPVSSNGFVRLTRLDGKWPEEQDTDFLRQLAAARALASYHPQVVPNSRKWAVRIIVVGVIGAPLLVWGVLKRSKSRETMKH
jgi:hypothetical protein